MGKAKRFNSYDAIVSQGRKTAENYGQARQNLSGHGSTFRNQPLKPPINRKNPVSEGNGTGKFLTSSMAADQTTNIAATNHVEFDTKDEDGGIVLQTGVGQADGIFELESGKKYELSAMLRPEFSGATGQLVVAWYDITNAAEIGSRAIYESQTHVSHNANQPVAEAIITPAANITAELRIISVTALTALANEYCIANLFEIALGGTSLAGGGGGGTSVSFPLTPDVNTIGSVSGAQTINLANTDAHYSTITLTGNVTFTFSNPPASGKEMSFVIDITQDATGGRTITWPGSVRSDPAVGTGADARTVVVGSTVDGGTNYDVLIVTGGTQTQGANRSLSNLSGVAINTSLLSDTNNTDDLGSDALEWKDLWIEGTANIDNLTLTSGSTVTTILDEDTLVSNSATALATQQSIKAYVDSQTANLTPWTENIDADGFDLQDLSNIEFRATTGAPASTVASIHAAPAGMTLNVPTGDNFDFTVAGVSQVTLDVTNMTLSAVDLDGNFNDIFDFGQVRLRETTTAPLVELHRDEVVADNTTIGTIDFEGETSASNKFQYAQISCTMLDDLAGQEDSDLVFGVTGAGAFGASQFTISNDKLEYALNLANMASGAEMVFYRNELTGGASANDDITRITLDAKDNLGARATFGQIIAEVEDPTSTTKDASLRIRLMQDNSLKTFIELNGGAGDNVEFHSNVDLDDGKVLSVFNATNTESISIDKDGTQGRINVTDQVQFAVSAVGQFEYDNGAVYPTTDNDIDLGKAAQEFKDLFIDGTANLDAITNSVPITISADFDFQTGSTVDFPQTGSASAGSGGTLPSNVEGFIVVKVAGTSRRVPFYPS